MKVFVAVLGGETQELELPAGKKVGHALTKAGFKFDSISKVKRDGEELNGKELLNEGDVLLVIKEKMKGASESEETKTIIFNVEKEIEKGNYRLPEGSNIFQMLKVFSRKENIDMAKIKLVKFEGKKIGFDEKVQEGGDYTVVVGQNTESTTTFGKEEDYLDFDDDDYSDY